MCLAFIKMSLFPSQYKFVYEQSLTRRSVWWDSDGRLFLSVWHPGNPLFASACLLFDYGGELREALSPACQNQAGKLSQHRWRRVYHLGVCRWHTFMHTNCTHTHTHTFICLCVFRNTILLFFSSCICINVYFCGAENSTAQPTVWAGCAVMLCTHSYVLLCITSAAQEKQLWMVCNYLKLQSLNISVHQLSN